MSKLSNDLGMLIRTSRQLRNLPAMQKDVAKEVRVSETHYSDIERGRRFPTHKMLVKICRALGIPIKEAELKAKDGLFKRWKGYEP